MCFKTVQIILCFVTAKWNLCEIFKRYSPAKLRPCENRKFVPAKLNPREN